VPLYVCLCVGGGVCVFGVCVWGWVGGGVCVGGGGGVGVCVFVGVRVGVGAG